MAWIWPEVAVGTIGRVACGLTSEVRSIVAVGRDEGASRRGAEAPMVEEGGEGAFPPGNPRI